MNSVIADYNKRYSLLSLFLLFCSSVSYGLAFLFPDVLWELIFLYPFFFLFAHKTVTSFDIFFWSFFLSSMHLFGICVALYRMGIAWFYLLSLLFYVPLSSVLIFFLVKYCCFWMKDGFFIHLSGLIVHRLWVTYLILLLFGRPEGYLLMHPVILLSNALCTPIIRYYDLFILTGLFYLTIAIPVMCYKLYYKHVHNKYLYAGVLVGTSILLILPFLRYQEIMIQKKEQLLPKKIAVLPLLFAKTRSISEVFRFLQDKINTIIASGKDVQLIVLPEGAIDVPISKELVDEYFQEKLPNIGILFGASCWKKNVLYNSCFFKIKDASTKMYRKRHALPLTERSIHSFISVPRSIKPSKNQHPLLKVADIQVVPYICSEFFFANTVDDEHQDYPILLLCNDIWFSGIASYIQDLMAKTVQFKAKNWNRSIVYVAYSRSFYIDQGGKIIPLHNS